MSLEQALSENTKAINNLIALLTSNNIALSPPAKAKSKNKVKAQSQEPVTLIEKPETTVATVSTMEEAVKTLMTLAKKDRDSAVAILAQFHARNAREIKEEQRADFLKALNERINNLGE